ncbi:MAG: hypothetical protein K2N44_01520 [Lachnospiraceae bacterium]|nr:hypothetical protein [Lachnospiraceae bacterium]
MKNIFIEENGVYSIDCSNAVWATDKMHEDYHNAGIHINDVDFLIENTTNILMVEYKNACIANAENPAAFQPMTDKKILIATRKFYDSLHYLRLLNKNKPVQYIYILEYPNGDATTRKRLRNRLKTELPFALQENIGNGKKLIEQVEVLSIDEWNADSIYGNYPMRRISG